MPWPRAERADFAGDEALRRAHRRGEELSLVAVLAETRLELGRLERELRWVGADGSAAATPPSGLIDETRRLQDECDRLRWALRLSRCGLATT